MATRYDWCATTFSRRSALPLLLCYLKEWVLNLAVAAGEEVIRLCTSATLTPLMGLERACEDASLQRTNSGARPR